MSYQIEPLAGQRQSGESNRAVQACNDFLRMGPGRSLTALMGKYRESQENSVTQSLNTLMKWSADYGWSERAAEYDKQTEATKNTRAKETMQSGLALDFERVDKLKRMADFLEAQIYEQGVTGTYHNVWMPDVKQIGSGEFAERVDIERFNAAIFEQYRGVLEDLAKETGGRAQRNQNINIDLANLTDTQLQRLARGEDLYHVLATPDQSAG